MVISGPRPRSIVKWPRPRWRKKEWPRKKRLPPFPSREYDVTIKIKNQKSGNSLLPAVEKIAEVNLARCYQCKKCSAGCPVAVKVSSAPAEIIRRLQLGAGDEILQTD